MDMVNSVQFLIIFIDDPFHMFKSISSNHAETQITMLFMFLVQMHRINLVITFIVFNISEMHLSRIIKSVA